MLLYVCVRVCVYTHTHAHMPAWDVYLRKRQKSHGHPVLKSVMGIVLYCIVLYGLSPVSQPIVLTF